jgi:uncharacterized protein YbaA (DUF1428 family)
MNDWDRDNLMFIMKSDYSTFKAWMEQATNDEVNYALQLIAEFKREQAQLKLLKELADEVHYPKVTDFTEANQVLSKFRL